MTAEALLPWPPSVLNPNVHPHYQVRARAVKKYRQTCGWACKAAGLVAPATGDIHVWMDYHQPDLRRRDEDNMQASVKAALDGLADALNVNDNRFRLHPFFSDRVVIGGRIKIRITAGPTP